MGRLGNRLLVFVLASIRKVRFPSLLFVTREIESFPSRVPWHAATKQ
jgi:hypothetical protein